MNSSTRPEPGEATASFDDEVLTSAQQQARILRDLGYRTEASHIERYVDGFGAAVVDEESAA